VDRGVKIAAAAGVLLIGLLAAMCFRHSPGSDHPAPQTGDQLVLRKDAVPQSAAPAAGSRCEPSTPPAASPDPNAPQHGATVLVPAGAGTSPEAAKGPAPAASPNTSQWGVSMGLMLPESGRRDTPARTHKIVDGDTLGALAERYLGSADKAQEIFQANRDVLPTPEILPIGAELKIPIGVDTSAPSTPTSSPPVP
jgi:hypothetical protein